MSDMTPSVPRSVSVWTAAAFFVVVFVAALLVAKNLAIDNVVVLHDEYLYKVWTDVTLSRQLILAHGLAPGVPTTLYTKLFELSAHAGTNAYDFAQLMNVGFWAIGMFVVLALALKAGIGGSDLLMLAVAISLAPMSVYTKYFMPEAMYAAMFTASVFLLMEAARRRSLVWFVAVGVLLGSMYYVKPHALFALGIAAAFTATCSNRWRSVVSLLAGFAVAFVLVRKCVPPMTHEHGGLGVYEGILHGLANRLASAGVGRLEADLFRVATAHVMMFLAFSGLPLVGALGAAFPRNKLTQQASPDDAPLARYLLLATAGLMAMTVVFTVLAGEAGRIHSRYYMFLAPLWLMQVALLRRRYLTRRGALVASILVLVGALYLWTVGRTYDPILPISFVSDGPEWGVLFTSSWLLATILVASTGLTCLIAWSGRGVRVLLAILAAASLTASVMAAINQKGVFRNEFVDGRDAIAVQQLLGTATLAQTVVVGTDTIVVDKFLFFLGATPMAELVPKGMATDQALGRHPGALAVILLSNDYPVPLHASCQHVGPDARICLPSPGL